MTILDKNFGDLLIQQLGESAKSLKKTLEQFETWDLIAADDKIAIVMQARHDRLTPSNHFITSFNDLLVMVFDKNLENTGNIRIGKSYRAFIISGEFPGWQVQGNKLHLLYNRNGGENFIGVYALLDLNKHTVDKQESITQEKMPSDAHMYPAATIWFENRALVPYYLPKGVGTKAWGCQYQLVEY